MSYDGSGCKKVTINVEPYTHLPTYRTRTRMSTYISTAKTHLNFVGLWVLNLESQ